MIHPIERKKRLFARSIFAVDKLVGIFAQGFFNLKTSDFDYDLPPRLIAQEPVEPRDSSRLLVLDRDQDIIHHSIFNRLGEYLHPGDLLVVNQTRVIPARLYGKKYSTGGKVELLLLN